MSMSKDRVIAAITAKLFQEFESLRDMANMAIDEATGEESKPENEYDTRALEASYLAAGQGARLLELQQLLAWFRVQEFTTADSVDLGALVKLEGAKGNRWLFVAPTGGTQVQVDGVNVQVISPQAALGEALSGLEQGDEVEVGPTTYEIAEIQ